MLIIIITSWLMMINHQMTDLPKMIINKTISIEEFVLWQIDYISIVILFG